MTTLAIRQQLHNYLEVADDKKIKAFYTMMEAEIKESAVEYTNELKAELDKRYADYKSGKAKMVTAAESKRRIAKLLKTK
jgi:Putative addiction module component